MVLPQIIPEIISAVTRRNLDSSQELIRSEDVYKVAQAESTKNDFDKVKELPQNPWLGPNNFGSPHCDSYCSESVSLCGPVTSKNIRVIRQRNPHGYTPCMVCNANNQMIGVSMHMLTFRFWLVVYDKDCNLISSTRLGRKHQGNFSGGYFHMNQLDQTIVVSENRLICFDTSNVTANSGKTTSNSLDPLWTSRNIVLEITGRPEENELYSAMPVWGDDPHLYWVLIAGVYSIKDEQYGAPAGMAVVRVIPDSRMEDGCITEVVDHIFFDREWNNNTFSVDELGAYFVTNVLDEKLKPAKHGYLRRTAFENGKIVVKFASQYSSARYLKVGQKNIGSGTTPTLIDTKSGLKLVAITDNNAPLMNVVVYDRNTGDPFSSTPVFTKMRSADEASLIGVENTLIVENNYGHEFTWPYSQLVPIEPGMTRLDLGLDQDGEAVSKPEREFECTWTDNRTSFLAMSMLARGSGIIFAHTADWSDDISATEGAMYYIIAMDAFTGRTIWRIPLGRGVQFRHDYGGVYFNRDGSLYVGTMNYFIGIQSVENESLQDIIPVLQ